MPHCEYVHNLTTVIKRLSVNQISLLHSVKRTLLICRTEGETTDDCGSLTYGDHGQNQGNRCEYVQTGEPAKTYSPTHQMETEGAAGGRLWVFGMSRSLMAVWDGADTAPLRQMWILSGRRLKTKAANYLTMLFKAFISVCFPLFLLHLMDLSEVQTV